MTTSINPSTIDEAAFHEFLDVLGVDTADANDTHVRAFNAARGDAVRTVEVERDELRARVDEAEEKLAAIAQGCLSLTREQLIKRITAVEPARWRAGVWLSAQLRPYRARIAELEHAALAVAAITRAAHVPFGPKQVPEHVADAQYLQAAASHIEGGYKVGGRNLTETVIELLRTVANIVEGDQGALARQVQAAAWRQGWAAREEATRTQFHTTARRITCPYDNQPVEVRHV